MGEAKNPGPGLKQGMRTLASVNVTSLMGNIALLGKLEADVICMQEVAVSVDDQPTAKRLMAGEGFSVAFSPLPKKPPRFVVV